MRATGSPVLSSRATPRIRPAGGVSDASSYRFTFSGVTGIIDIPWWFDVATIIASFVRE